MSQLIIIQRFDNAVEANIVKGKLISEGIECFLQDEHIVGLNPLLSNATGGIKLVVSEEDVDIAKGILQQDKEDYKEIVKCKSCGSTDVHFISQSKNIFNWIGGIIGLAFGAMPLYIKKIYKCEQCKSEFTMEEIEKQ